MNLEQLRAALKQKLDAMDALVSENENGLNEEQATQFDEMEAEAESLKGNIKRLEKLEADKAQYEGMGRQTQPSTPRTFAKPKDPEAEATSGFDSLADFSMAVKNSRYEMDERLKFMGAPANYHREGGSEGGDGYMVPTRFKDEVIELAFNEPDLLGMVDSEPTDGNSVQFLKDETTPWGSTGIQAYWGAEAGKLKRSRIETDGEELKLHKLHAFVEATDELLEDAPRLNNRLTRGAARAINWKANESILFGTGAGQPLGFNVSDAKVSVAKEASQSAATVVVQNIAKMYSRVMNPGRAIWMANQDILPQLIDMQIGNQPVWTAPNQGIQNAPGGMLLGRPVMFSDHCQTLGTETDLMLVDPMGYYLIRKSTGVKFSSSVHLLFDYDVQCFKWTFRIGGQPFLSQPVTPNKGSSTRSSFITLATRS